MAVFTGHIRLELEFLGGAFHHFFQRQLNAQPLVAPLETGRLCGTSSSASAPKPPAGANTTSMKVTATEKKLVQLYRSADSQTKKEVMATLKGETVETLVGSLIGSAFSALTGKKETPEDGED